jgi:hypothetical protein
MFMSSSDQLTIADHKFYCYKLEHYNLEKYHESQYPLRTIDSAVIWFTPNQFLNPHMLNLLDVVEVENSGPLQH